MSLNFGGTMLSFDECITSVVIHFHFILMHSSDCSCINSDERLQSCAIISSWLQIYICMINCQWRNLSFGIISAGHHNCMHSLTTRHCHQLCTIWTNCECKCHTNSDKRLLCLSTTMQFPFNRDDSFNGVPLWNKSSLVYTILQMYRLVIQ